MVISHLAKDTRRLALFFRRHDDVGVVYKLRLTGLCIAAFAVGETSIQNDSGSEDRLGQGIRISRKNLFPPEEHAITTTGTIREGEGVTRRQRRSAWASHPLADCGLKGWMIQTGRRRLRAVGVPATITTALRLRKTVSVLKFMCPNLWSLPPCVGAACRRATEGRPRLSVPQS